MYIVVSSSEIEYKARRVGTVIECPNCSEGCVDWSSSWLVSGMQCRVKPSDQVIYHRGDCRLYVLGPFLLTIEENLLDK